MSNKEQLWKDAYRKCRLNKETLLMAKELGLNPRSLIKNNPSPTQRWKAPVKIWVREMYEKRFPGRRPQGLPAVRTPHTDKPPHGEEEANAFLYDGELTDDESPF